MHVWIGGLCVCAQAIAFMVRGVDLSSGGIENVSQVKSNKRQGGRLPALHSLTLLMCIGATELTIVLFVVARFLAPHACVQVQNFCNCLLYTSPSPRDRG